MFSEFNWLKLTAESPSMIILIMFSIVTFGVAIERAVYYWRRRGNPDDVARTVAKDLRNGDTREALAACSRTPHPIGSVLEVVVGSPADNHNEVDERIYVALSGQKLLLERNLNVLGTMAGTAPLVGLLGTVWGIMRAFHDMASVGSAAPTVVAAGIAEALVTTAVGLIVAVPALILYNHFMRRSSVMLTMAENHTRTIRAWMAAQGGTGTPESRKNTPARDASGRHAVAPEPLSVG
ncbi:MAG TPA: MotA/TolQ/ExbB proton channel family protein [Candidatus Krumholzibacteria bacterium]|nr:MotA/TolQ/ExbB proton channel family protein [Candidatus Krumholzibacteria bacterium]